MEDKNETEISKCVKNVIDTIALLELMDELIEFKGGKIIGDGNNILKCINDLILYYDSLVCEIKKGLLMRSIIFKIRELNFEEERNIFWIRLQERGVARI